MELQYISDEAGNHTAVVIPIQEWNNITAKHKDLKEFENDNIVPNRKAAEFRGCISKETALKMIADIEQSRNEWERNT